MADTSELNTRLSKLEERVRFFAWLIPAASALIALLILIFWGVEKAGAAKRFAKWIEDSGLERHADNAREASDKTQKLYELARKSNAGFIMTPIKVISITHIKGASTGRYFYVNRRNFDILFEGIDWHHMNVGIANSRTGTVCAGKVFDEAAKDISSTAGGRFHCKENGEWMVGDTAIIITLDQDEN